MMECNPFFCWPEEPPESVGSKGPKGQQHEELLKKQSHAHEFALPLKHACAAEPLCCIASGLGAPCGCTACYSRMLVLESYAGGIDDYLCCQGYVGGFCCTDMRTVLPGSRVGLFLEGCLCPVFSLSIARIHLMDKKSLRPDPMDFQIIACAPHPPLECDLHTRSACICAPAPFQPRMRTVMVPRIASHCPLRPQPTCHGPTCV